MDKNELLHAGIDIESKDSPGLFLHVDNETVDYYSRVKGVEFLPIGRALKEDAFAKGNIGRSFKEMGVEYEKGIENGYFLRVKKGATVVIPLQICFLLKNKALKQKVHNMLVVEEGAKAYVVNGCVSEKASSESMHFGYTEFFVKEGGYLNFTMVHSWNETVEVMPKSVALVEAGAVFVSNYVCLKPVKKIKMYPTAILEGADARGVFNSIVVSHKGSMQDIGSRVIFKAQRTSAEIASRVVSFGGEVIARGHLKAQEKQVKAHLECSGLIVSDVGKIHAVPELETYYSDVEMSHEAAIGRISKEELEYLACRGIPFDKAQSYIIRGFIDTDILGIPEELKRSIDEVKDQLSESVI